MPLARRRCAGRELRPALRPGEQRVVGQAEGALPLDPSCTGTLRLEDAAGTLVDTVTLPGQAAAGATYGRIPDGTGSRTLTVPTPGTANAVPSDGKSADPARLYDPLQVTEIERVRGLAYDGAPRRGFVRSLSRRSEAQRPRHVPPARRQGRLRGQVRLRRRRTEVPRAQGADTQQQVQDSSIIAESTSPLLFAASGVPSARVGCAYVRVNGVEYGLYADVETVDSVIARRFFTGSKYISRRTTRTTWSPAASGSSTFRRAPAPISPTSRRWPRPAPPGAGG